MAGVLLYLAGYIVFAALTLATMFDATLPNCYSIGGFLFVFGSALLVRATVGPLPQKVRRLEDWRRRTKLSEFANEGNNSCLINLTP